MLANQLFFKCLFKLRICNIKTHILMGIFDSKVGQLLGLNKDISSGRLSICKKCPLMLNRYGRLICNDKMWLNPETGDFSTTEKDGYNMKNNRE